MAKAIKTKELIASTQDRVGMLAEVTSAVAGAGVNITAICAYAMDGKAMFMMLTSDNGKAAAALKAKKFAVEESDVIAVTLSNKIGTAKELADKLAKAGVDLRYIYGSTGSGPDSLLVISAKDMNRALEACK
jgi:hypothetical protein